MRLGKQLKQMKEASIERMPQSIIQIFENSIEEIKNNGLKEKALKIGEQIPDLPLTSIDGETVLLSELQKADYLILNFYRGGWCPYCNMELREYERLRKDFNQLNTDILGISAERVEYTSQTFDKNSLSFPILTDVNAQLMKEIGIVFQLDTASKEEYINFGIHLDEIHANNSFELPVPAVYVINKDREIVYVHIEEDYMTRLEPSILLELIKNKLTAVKS
ncbi:MULTISPECIES: peroxiredoxin-like family protein [Zobellia]|uniref:peroxiredoxin-like family protein n=1 Tax=Zobellia TaxID=112040 RepID=UPI00188D6AAE|nr:MULTISPECIES: peroxiredoxin-like family protein [Zobellia]MBU2947045.1 AhpC/TSA family protein [Zobellia uliginosa]